MFYEMDATNRGRKIILNSINKEIIFYLYPMRNYFPLCIRLKNSSHSASQGKAILKNSKNNNNIKTVTR